MTASLAFDLHEGIDRIDVRKATEPAVARVDDPDAVLPHQRRHMCFWHIISSRLIAGCSAKQIPKSLFFTYCAHMRSGQ